MSVRKDLTPSQTAGNTPVPRSVRSDQDLRTARDVSSRKPVAPPPGKAGPPSTKGGPPTPASVPTTSNKSARGSVAPPGGASNKSARGSVPPPKQVSVRKPVEEKPAEAAEGGVKQIVDNIWKTIISVILAIADFLNSIFEAIADVCVKIYRVIMFIYRKPHHTKELISTTFHLIRVSYDAEIWSWTEIFDVLKSHLIAPMTKAPPPTKADKKAEAKKVK